MTALGLVDASPLLPAAADELWWASDRTWSALDEDEKGKLFLHATGILRCPMWRTVCTPRRERTLQAMLMDSSGEAPSFDRRVRYEPRPRGQSALNARAQRA